MMKIPKIHIPGAVFYVTSRGDNNADIFKDNDDYKAYLELLKKYKTQYGFKLFAYCLMPSYLHLLIELKEGLKLSDIMHDLSANYTKYFNGKYQRKGHLFQERYKVAILEKEGYMSEEIKDIGPSFAAGIPAQQMEGLAGKLKNNAISGSDRFVEMVKKQASEIEAVEVKTTQAQRSRLVYASTAGLIILALLAGYLYQRTVAIRKKYRNEMAKRNLELQRQMDDERKKVMQDLEEKYAADRVSYEAMARRLEIEKKKAQELEKKAKK
jgi:REP element-mobilizing transposase RayT